MAWNMPAIDTRTTKAENINSQFTETPLSSIKLIFRDDLNLSFFKKEGPGFYCRITGKN
jgi:hypothetical protein